MKDSFKNIVIKGTFIFTLSNFIVSFLNYASNSLSAKSLGPSGFGELSTLFAYINVFSVPLTIVSTLIIVKLGKAKERRIEMAQEIEQWFRCKILEKRVLVLALSLTVVLIPFITNLSITSSIVLYALVGLGVASTLYFSLLQGMHLFTKFALILVVASTARLVGTLFAYFNFGGINTIYAGLVIGGFASMVMAKKFAFYAAHIEIKTITVRLRSYLVRKQTLITAVSLLSVALFLNIDLMFVKKNFAPEMAGIYSSWSLLARIIGYFTAPILGISLLYFSAKESEKDHKKFLYLVVFLIVAIGSLMLLMYQKYSSEIFILIFSSKFLSIAPLAPHAALFGMLMTIIALINNYYITNDSRFSLITPLIIPIYIILLFFYGVSLESIISINIGTAFFASGLLMISLLHS